MITVNDILEDAYEEAYATTEYRASDTLWLKHLSQIVQRFWNRVVNRRKARCNWDIWTATTVSLQDEYTKPLVSSIDVWAAHIETISVAYSSDTYAETWNKIYTPCTPATDDQIQDWNYYLENQSNDNPIFFERDWSIFIAPDPRSTEVWTNRLQITGIRSIASWDWTSATTELEMKLPLFTHDVIKLWLVWKIHSYLRRDRNIVIDAKNEYEREEANALNNMFVENPFLSQYPDSIWGNV